MGSAYGNGALTRWLNEMMLSQFVKLLGGSVK